MTSAPQHSPSVAPDEEADGTSAAAGAPARRNIATDLALIGTFAALTAVCSLLSLPVGPGGAPVTLQTFAVLLAGAVLGARRGALAMLLYLAVGFAGLPIFAEGRGGLGALGVVTLGFLLSFPLAAFLIGAVVERAGRRGWATRTGLVVLGGVLASVVMYAIGVPVLAARAGLSLPAAAAASAVFLPLDAVKLVLAAVVASSVHRAFPDLLRRR